MVQHSPLTAEAIEVFLEETLEAEFSFLRLDELIAAIHPLPRLQQDYLLDWVKRISTTNIEIAYQFAGRAVPLLDQLDRRVLETWALTAMDTSRPYRPARCAAGYPQRRTIRP